MYSILIDTHSNEINIVLFKDYKSFYIKTSLFNNQSKYIIPTIIEVLKFNNITFNDIKEVIVVNGPGSFTGVRIGVTIAKTIAYSLKIPIKSISSILLKAINIKSDTDFSVSITDNKGYYIGEFTKDNELKNNYFYMLKSDYEKYITQNKVLNEDSINWDLIYDNNYLTTEDCYGIKPLYIKKIEVEK